MFKGIEHVGLMAKNSKAEAKWFCDVLGFEIAWSYEDRGIYFIRGKNGVMMEILQTDKKIPNGYEMDDPGMRHLAIEVDDFDKAYAELQKKSVKFIDKPSEVGGGARLVYFTDPEGNLIHIVHRPK